MPCEYSDCWKGCLLGCHTMMQLRDQFVPPAVHKLPSFPPFSSPANNSGRCRYVPPPIVGQSLQLEEVVVSGYSLWEVTRGAAHLTQLTCLKVVTNPQKRQPEVGVPSSCLHVCPGPLAPGI